MNFELNMPLIVAFIVAAIYLVLLELLYKSKSKKRRHIAIQNGMSEKQLEIYMSIFHKRSTIMRACLSFIGVLIIALIGMTY